MDAWALSLASWIAPIARCSTFIEKSGFGFTEFPRVAAYLDACRARPTWVQTPRLPGL